MMVYESEQEMEKVLGSFESNSFIKQEVENLQSFKQEVSNWIENLKNN